MVNDNGLLLIIGACVTYLLKLKYKQPEYNQQQQIAKDLRTRVCMRVWQICKNFTRKKPATDVENWALLFIRKYKSFQKYFLQILLLLTINGKYRVGQSCIKNQLSLRYHKSIKFCDILISEHA